MFATAPVIVKTSLAPDVDVSTVTPAPAVKRKVPFTVGTVSVSVRISPSTSATVRPERSRLISLSSVPAIAVTGRPVAVGASFTASTVTENVVLAVIAPPDPVAPPSFTFT